jgi:hypothetical protein
MWKEKFILFFFSSIEKAGVGVPAFSFNASFHQLEVA